MIDNPQSQESSVLSPGSTRMRLYTYLAPLLLVPLVIILAGILIVPTNWLAFHSGDPFLVTLGYGSRLHNKDCSVLIYGDSTALGGLSPAIIHDQTGLTVCNIAEFEGMTLINGTMLLDDFLAHNPRPRFLLFMYAPESLNAEAQRANPDVSTFEAITWRFRQPHKLASLISLMRHPDDVFKWAEHGVRMSMNGLFIKPLPPETITLRDPTNGISKLGNLAPAVCNRVGHHVEPNRSWVGSLRAKYGTDGTTVLIDSVIIPDCDADVEFFRNALSGVIDNKVQTLPIQDFFTGGRHVTPEGSVLLSQMVANQIKEHVKATSQEGVH